MASRWVQDGFNIGFGCCMTGAKYIAKNGMDLILLLMASRWVKDGFNIGFGRRSQDGLKIALGLAGLGWGSHPDVTAKGGGVRRLTRDVPWQRGGVWG